MSPPRNGERRRGESQRRSEESAAAKPLELFAAHTNATSDIPAQIRRRRTAAVRCEPLADGRRDTLSPRRKPEARKHLVAEVGKRTVWLRDGERGDRVFALLEAAQVERRQWDWQRRCWMVSVARADDVLAFAEYAERWTVTCEVVDR